MHAESKRAIRQRAGNRCEYCLLPQHATELPFHVDHVIARQHQGGGGLSNLALACDRCNLCKGTNLSSIDPDSTRIVRLFNPRVDHWNEHFVLREALIIGLTPTGRATVTLLQMNSPDRLVIRQLLIEAGEF